MRIYIAGAWAEQHQRARPMIEKVREAGLVVTLDWTKAEGDVCACGHVRQLHSPYLARAEFRGPCGECYCEEFNGIGTSSDSSLSDADRRKCAQDGLDGVLSADVVWLLAANDKGACGSWVELGAALAAREWHASGPSGFGRPRKPKLVVSGPKNKRTIFTELADALFETDAGALEYVRELYLATVPG
jgi:hypothetical protein